MRLKPQQQFLLASNSLPGPRRVVRFQRISKIFSQSCDKHRGGGGSATSALECAVRRVWRQTSGYSEEGFSRRVSLSITRLFSSLAALINKTNNANEPGFLPSEWSSRKDGFRFQVLARWRLKEKYSNYWRAKKERKTFYDLEFDLQRSPVCWLKIQIFSPLTNEYPFVKITHVGSIW